MIVERPFLNLIGVVTSTYALAIKFSVKSRVDTVRGE